ncbi:Polyadenylation and cleavage factor-like protein 4 [Forsythia ovata]|uniref:Polyadenylation and cleavage factor-like protein 4 n=1 Tax=Forsythia ovata TaxID=205694 RepID=A0ABD1R833_9LAMI
MNGGVSRFENPTPLKTGGFTKSAMSNDVAPLKPPPPLIIDRFRGMLKEREAQLSILNNAGHDSDSNLDTDEIVRLYEIVLSELTLNSKPIITDLTMIAGQQRAHGKGISDAICDRIIEVPVEQKLPSLYLLDSIVKNIGGDYVRHFSARLPEVFCEAYTQVHHSMRPAMRHLFGTWSTVFPLSVLRMIEAQLQFSPAVNCQPSVLAPLKASDSPRTTYGIHINPEYLEARHQFGHSTADTVGAKGLSSSARARTGHTTSPSPPSLDEFGVDSYPRAAERASPSNSRFEYGLNRVMGRDEETNKLQARNWHGEPDQRLKNSAVLNNGVDLQGPRALIDAYGIDHREKKMNHKHPKVKQFCVNGFDQKTASRTWQNTEEEEFDWEDMSPTLAHQNMDRFATQRAAPLVTDYRSNQFSSTTDSSIVEGVPPVSGHGGISKITGPHSASNQNAASSYTRESWNLPHQLSQHYLNAKEGSSYSGIGAFSAAGEQKPPTLGNFSSVDGKSFGSHSNIDSLPPEIRSANALDSSKAWHPARLHNSHPSPSLSALPPEFHIRSRFPITYTGNVINNNSIQYEQHLDNTGMSTSNLPRAPSQLSRPVVHPHLLPPRNHGYAAQGRGPPIGIALSNLVPVVQSSLPILNAPNTSFHLPGTAIPSLPRGPTPGTTQSIPPGNTGQVAPNPPAQGALSGLISSLMAQGLISLTKQDSVGVEFDQDLLKLRNESAITALYANLPRQCKTCGLRFKSQEEHSKHMDWHVNKNRTLKTRKLKPSPKWFVSVSMWLSGAEAVGTEAVPGFLPADNDVEKKEDEEMAVPADEDQNVCALCGEPFVDFYSDERDEWMYRGATYMNAQAGSTAGMDRSELGPIVHAKCRSESHAIPTEDFTKDEVELTEEGHQRKRMRC